MRLFSLIGFGIFALSITIACSSKNDDPLFDASNRDDAGSPLSQSAGPFADASTDGAFAHEGGAPTDASLDAAALPPALQMCTTCLQATCEPQVTACLDDPTCTALLQCTTQSGCLQQGEEPTACVASCGEDLGLSKLETAQQLAKLTAIVASCGGCLSGCVPDGGRDAN